MNKFVRKLSSLNRLLVEMPKEKAHLPILKATRKFKKDNMSGGKYPAGIINIQVLGTTPSPSIYLFTDQMRYLFNCGEGTQRLAHEHKTKLSKLEHIFLTNNKWEMIGGLPGVCLTVQDIGIDKLNVHGPRGVDNLFRFTRRFVILKDLRIEAVNAEKAEKYSDHVIDVTYVPILSSEKEPTTTTSNIEEDATDYYESYRKSHGQKMIEISSELSEKSSSSICYIIQPKKKEGTLQIEKCVELGVPPGPLLGKLKSGQDVEINGKTIKASQVTSVACPGPKFLIVDCPTESHLENFIKNETLIKTDPVLIIHFTPLKIMLKNEYKKWMESFDMTRTQHLILNELSSPLGSEAIHRLQFKLNAIDSNSFPVLENKQIDCLLKPEVLKNYECRVIIACTMLKFCLRPCINLDTDSIVKVKDKSEYLKEIEPQKNVTKNVIQSYPKVTFLGTGSSIPNKTRNVSSFLLQIDKENSMLFDCGEGTLIQLTRFFSSEKVEKILSSIKVIYISHLHADHHLGLISLLKKNKDIKIVCPKELRVWLGSFCTFFEKINYTLIPCDEIKEDALKFAKINKIKTCRVKHCPNAFGVAVEFDNEKLTYSGDTMPCNDLVKLGKNSTLLIHEATMEDELKAEAVLKQHSTVTEAITSGKLMDAKYTILTHFSQRYAKLPLVYGISDNVGVAFDNMVVSFEHIHNSVGPLLYQQLKGVFSDEIEEMEGRSEKRRRRNQINQNLDDKIN